MKNNIFVIFIYALFFFIACTNQVPTAGGTDSDNYFKGVVYNSDLKPLQGAKIYLIKPKLNENSVVNFIYDSTLSDSLGKWQLKFYNGICFARVRKEKDSSSTLKRLINYENSKIIEGENLKTIIGHVYLNDIFSIDTDIKIYVSGTDIMSNVNTDGSYMLKNVPTGDCDIIYSYNNKKFVSSINVTTSKSKIDVRDIVLDYINFDTLKNSEYSGLKKVFPLNYLQNSAPQYYDTMSFDDVNYVDYSGDSVKFIDVDGNRILPLADFEYNVDYTLINDFYTNSGLNSLTQNYIIGDSLMKIVISRYDSGGYFFKDNFNDQILSSRDRSIMGWALHNEYLFSDSTNYTSGCFTLFFDKNVDNSNGNVNLSKLKYVNFFAKGSGKIRIMLQDSVTVLNSYGLYSLFQKDIELNKEWTSYEIPIDDFIADSLIDVTKINISRTDALKKIEYLKFMTLATKGSTVSLWLDNITLTGVAIDDLKR